VGQREKKEQAVVAPRLPYGPQGIKVNFKGFTRPKTETAKARGNRLALLSSQQERRMTTYYE